MKILILGGSRFQGKYLCNDLINRGHKLTVMNRGITGENTIGENQRFIRCDRKEDNPFRELEQEEFDACIDTSGYSAEDLQKSGKTINTENYIFISTSFVYKRTNNLVDRESAIEKYGDDEYAQKKIDAEEELIKQRGDNRFLIVRPTMLIGKGDHTERMILAIKMARNKLRPDSKTQSTKINLVDVRDYVKNLVYHIENKTAGIANITGVNTTIGKLWQKIENVDEREKAKDIEIIKNSYVPYSEDKTGNRYKMENPIENTYNLSKTIKEVSDYESNNELKRYDELKRKYSLI